MIQTTTGSLARGSVGQGKVGNASPVAPAAGATITSVGNVTPGLWLIEVWIALTAGAPAAADVNNARLFKSAPNSFGMVLLFPAVANQVNYFSQVMNITTETNIGVAAIGNATAGVAYSATLVVTPLTQNP